MPYTPTTGSGSALSAQMRYNLSNFTSWLSANSQTGKGMVGEMGWPGSSNPGIDLNYDPGFNLVGQQMFLDINAANLHYTMWCSAEWNVDLRAYRNADGQNDAFNYRTTISSILEANLTNGGTGVLRGVNIAGADFSDAGPNGALNGGSVGAQYYYPQKGDWAALGSRGITLVRLPVRWERLQPTLKQPLSSSELGYITTALGYANQYGVKVLLDIHNYGRYDTAAATNTSLSTNGVYDLGQNAPSTHNGYTVGGTMISCFTDLWTRIATALHGTAGLWSYGLCNEPHDLTGNVATWQSACQAAVEAIRLIDQTAHINVGGYNYQGIAQWSTNNGSTAWLTETIPAGQTGAGSARNTDPLIVWEGHMYFDYDGTYSGSGSSFSSLNSSATSAGYSSYSNSGYTVPSTDVTSQTGNQVLFKSSMDAAADWTTVTQTTAGSVTIPYASLGNPGNSVLIAMNSKGEEDSVRKTLSTPAASFSFDMYLPTGATLSTSNNFAILHCWDQHYYSGTGIKDLVELRVLGSGSGYVIAVTDPNGSYTTATGTTVLQLGKWNNVKVTVGTSSASSYINGSGTADATQALTNTSSQIGGVALGEFYGTSYVGNIYFDNAVASVIATYDAPPNGGLLTYSLGGAANTNHGLLGFFG